MASVFVLAILFVLSSSCADVLGVSLSGRYSYSYDYPCTNFAADPCLSSSDPVSIPLIWYGNETRTNLFRFSAIVAEGTTLFCLPSTAGAQTRIEYSVFSPWTSETFETTAFPPLSDFRSFVSTTGKDCFEFEASDTCTFTSEKLSILPTEYKYDNSSEPTLECVYGLAAVSPRNLKGSNGKYCGSWGTQNCNDYAFSPLQYVEDDVEENNALLTFDFPANEFYEYEDVPKIAFPQAATLSYRPFNAIIQPLTDKIKWVDALNYTQGYASDLQVGDGAVLPTIVDTASAFVYCDAECVTGFLGLLNAFLNASSPGSGLDSCETTFSCPTLAEFERMDDAVTLDIKSTNGYLVHRIKGSSLVQPVTTELSLCQCLVKGGGFSQVLGVPAMRNASVHFRLEKAEPKDCSYDLFVTENIFTNSTMSMCALPVAIGWESGI